jgi:hypothetical protein
MFQSTGGTLLLVSLNLSAMHLFLSRCLSRSFIGWFGKFKIETS